MISLLLLAAAPVMAAEPLPSFAGIQLGAPLAMPECQRLKLSFPPPVPVYASSQSGLCFQYTDAQQSGAMVNFPVEQMPKIASFNLLPVTLVNGRVEGVFMNTLDYNNADFLVGELSRKFGKPTSVRDVDEHIENISVPGRIFEWDELGFTVTYETTVGIDHGLIAVQTEAGKAADEAQRAKVFEHATPL